MPDLADSKDRLCTNEDCEYNTNGICVEGKGKDCQFLELLLDDQQSALKSIEKTDDIESKIFRLPSGNDLSESELISLTYKFNCNLILLIGEPECGKSTLYASIFDRFQKGNLGGFYFSQTVTPISFEERAHHARMISQNKKSLTGRTNTKVFGYLHLGIRDKDLSMPIQHLIFADVNGEKYQDARNNDDVMRSLTVLKRASHIFFIADGEALLDTSKRQIVRSDIIKLVQRAIQNDMFRISQKINLLVTKWDVIHAGQEEENIKNFLINPLLNKFPDLFNKVFFLIASRSQNQKYPAGSGLEEFIELCLTKPGTEAIENLEVGMSAREFQKFKYRKR